MTLTASRTLPGVVAAAAIAAATIAAVAPGPFRGLAIPVSLSATADTVQFTHERHVSVDCSQCHRGGGAVPRTDIAWCRSCHHSRGPSSCARCHDSGTQVGLDVSTAFTMPGGIVERELSFPHEPHRAEDCSSCHGSPPGAIPDDFGCVQCHDRHHQAETIECLSCHRGPPSWAHQPAVVHEGCAGGVCHKRFDLPDEGEVTRAACTICHENFPVDQPLPPIPGREPHDTSGILRGPSPPGRR